MCPAEVTDTVVGTKSEEKRVDGVLMFFLFQYDGDDDGGDERKRPN